jgi:hypothetical protein
MERESHLKNVVVGVQVESADVDLDKVLAEEIVGELLHLLRPGGGPHQHLHKKFVLPYIAIKKSVPNTLTPA